MKYKGFDISQWNGSCDLQKAKNSGMNFVLIRSSFGNVAAYPNQKDKEFENNVRKAKLVGLPFGIYHYSYATTVEGMRAEARGFVALLNTIKPIPHIVALDIEEKTQYNLSTSQLESITKAFIDIVEGAGYFCALYSYESFLCKYSQAFRDRYAIWCANITKEPSVKYGIWQYSFIGKVAGIRGDVDLNQTDIDYPTIIKQGGLNGYQKAQSATKPVLDTTGFKNGDKSLGVLALKELLALAKKKGWTTAEFDCSHDKFATGTEKAVNDILDKWGYEKNGIAGTKFVKKLGDSLGG